MSYSVGTICQLINDTTNLKQIVIGKQFYSTYVVTLDFNKQINIYPMHLLKIIEVEAFHKDTILFELKIDNQFELIIAAAKEYLQYT